MLTIEKITDPLQRSAHAATVFGQPITAHGRTVIPVARASYGFGGGSAPERETDQAEESEGGGGVGGVSVSPVGVIEVTEAGTRWVPIDDGRLAIATLAGIAAGLVLGGLLRR